MRRLGFGVMRLLFVLLIGGMLGAALVRMAPGLDSDEEQLDSRLSHASMQALMRPSDADGGLAHYYLRYLNKLLHGDLGYSKTLNEPVKQLLVERLPETARSVVEGLLLAWTLGLALAIASVLARNRAFKLFASTCAGIVLCMPAAMLALFFVLARAPGRLVIGLIVFPRVFHYAGNLLEQSFSRPHVLQARARGLSTIRVVLAHIVLPVLPQILAVVGISISMAFAAAIPVEVICDTPGIGQLAWKAAMGRDFNLLVNLTMVITAITLIANAGSGLLWMQQRVGAA